MTDETIPTDVDANINESLGENAPKKRARKKATPSYQVIGDSKIPVSKATGLVWKSRLSQARKHTENVAEAWSEAIRYFNNDQLGHRVSKGRLGGVASGNVVGNQRLNANITETENVVFANVTTMVPALYARNPEAEFTSNVESKKRLATITERLVNVIGGQQASPGINLKPKAKRCVVTCLLTNRAWIKIGWITREESSEKALADLASLAKQLEKAKTPKKIIEIEGRLQALEESIDTLQPSGPFAMVKSPFDIMVDPNAKEIDLSDANWLIEKDMIPTEFILAKYATEKGKTGEFKSIYAPTHIMKIQVDGDDISNTDNSIDNFSLFDQEKDTAKSFGFNDDVSFDKAKMTEVFKVWDKVTRRMLMFNGKDWTWPIWVWDDPLQLDTFFPYYPLTFFESPKGPLTKGEVTYYLDQQDSINEITDEKRRARRWARRNVFFNQNVINQADVSAVINGDDGTVRGLNIPIEVKLSDVIGTIPTPSFQFESLFNKEEIYRAIDRISSVGTVLRGEQFKTNTNKAAVAANSQAANMRVDEKGDQIEDWIGAIYWGIAQLCLMNMPLEDVVKLIGEEAQDVWENLSKDEISDLSQKVVGGSTKKPTSAAKKEEALEFGQVLGQFVNAAPGPVLKLMLQVMEKAFDEVTLREEDFIELQKAIDQQAGGQQPPQEGQPGGQNDISTASPEQLKQVLAKLPPELKQQVQSAINSGVSPQEALKSVIQQAEQQAGQQQAPAQLQ
ncbi:hypothetical protein LCGC14_1925890 [marine sediment metagenome]|uniref:Portal protein n=1 Tax=marine sediment metagenome TaxID=412755 RepID=A0A0F9GCV3_9ZZZZ